MSATVKMITKYLDSSKACFWKAVEIYLKHPNSINKQAVYGEVISLGRLRTCLTDCDIEKLCNELGSYKNLDKKLVEEKLRTLGYYDEDCADSESLFEQGTGIFFCARRLIPKSSLHVENFFYEFCFIDFDAILVIFNSRFVFSSLTKTNCNFMSVIKYKYMKLTFDGCHLNLYYNNDVESRGVEWLKLVFLKKWIKLMSGADEVNKVELNFIKQVPVVQYYQLYNNMKQKYGKFLVENWPEKTDPKKFVYEDIGIASYLMLLWNEGNIPTEETKKMKFVDLGCGNGLLVHILNSEGHKGVGLDIRKRKIWDLYPPSTILKVETIIPCASCVYPEADWLIGNHSDELTAWIPIMASRSHQHCQYFVLPCCPYKLNGQAYERKNSNVSCYQDFITYVERVSQICGFKTFMDKLRIPSTKRICLVGYKSPSDKAADEISQSVERFVDEECGKNNSTENTLPSSFKPREALEPVRNCTKLPKEFLDRMLMKIMGKLLSEENICSVDINNQIKKWNLGRKLSIKELAESISCADLQQMKKECKGLQTLLRNHHYIFHVVQGQVQFRHPDSMAEISLRILKAGGKMKWKMKECWFYENHPDGCPLMDDKCSYRHKVG